MLNVFAIFLFFSKVSYFSFCFSVTYRYFLMACAQPLRDVASLMIELGLRPSEILNLKRNDISLCENYLQVQEGKTKNARRKLPLSIESRKVLEYRLQTIEGECLFPNVKVVRWLYQ